jgi:hypothetical protein
MKARVQPRLGERIKTMDSAGHVPTATMDRTKWKATPTSTWRPSKAGKASPSTDQRPPSLTATTFVSFAELLCL